MENNAEGRIGGTLRSSFEVRSSGEKEGIPISFSSGGIFSMDERYYLERQNYNDYLLLYTMRGEGALDYEGKSYSLVPGTVFLIDCMKFQRYRTVKKQWEFCWIHFRTEILREYVDEIYRRYGAVFTISDGATMESRIRSAISLFQGYDPTASYQAFGLIAELLGMLYASAQKGEQNRRISEDTASVIRLIREKYFEKLTLEVIAREIGHSKYYLAHQFKAETGVAIYGYLTLFRISKGKVLLQNTNLPVAEIAEQIGFASVSNFIRTFSQYESMTPHQYRKQWQI